MAKATRGEGEDIKNKKMRFATEKPVVADILQSYRDRESQPEVKTVPPVSKLPAPIITAPKNYKKRPDDWKGKGPRQK